MDTNLFQIRIGDMDIYFSFKIPIAYRSKKHGLRIRGKIHPEVVDSTLNKHIEIITVCNSKQVVFTEEKIFDYEIEDQFKRTIYDLGKKFTLERMGFNVSGQRNSCKLGNRPVGTVEKG